MTLDRRSFLKLVGAGAGAVGAVGLPMIGQAAELMPKSGKRVVVVGGGYGGTIAAKYIRMMDKNIEVVLIERNDHFVSCPFSNLYLGGLLPDLSTLTIKYDKLAANHGVKVVQAEVTGVDPAAKSVTTSKGTIAYDRLVVAPGIDFRLDEMKGYDAAAMDGGKRMQVFRRVTFPLIMPTTYFLLVVSVIEAFQVFTDAAAALNFHCRNPRHRLPPQTSSRVSRL